jgi:Concanavalin A-like lectin/glucanases superfamily
LPIVTATGHTFLVIETSLPNDGTIADYRRLRSRHGDEQVGQAGEPYTSRQPLTSRRAARSLLLIVTLLCLAVATPARAATLVGEWSLDEGVGQVAHDRSPFHLDGHLGLAGGVDSADPTWVPGIAGWALRFDGADAVALRDSVALEPAHLTVEAWVRRQGTPGAYAYIVSKGSVGCDHSSYGLYTGAGGGIAFYVSSGNGWVVSPAGATPQIWDGAWHHVAGTFDGGTVRLYIDGAEVGAGSADDHPIQYGLESKAPYIGTYLGTCARGFTGDIDDVRIWSSALTRSEIAASRPTEPILARPLPSNPRPPVSGAPPPPVTGCVLTTSREALRAQQRNRLVVTVRHESRPLWRVRVALRGRRVRIVRRSGRDGRARFVVRPSSSDRSIRVRVLSSAPRCGVATIPVLR